VWLKGDSIDSIEWSVEPQLGEWVRVNATEGAQTIVMRTRGVESELARIWSRVLQIPVESIDPDANFFSLGGDSLLIACVADEVASRFFSVRPDHAPGIVEFFSHGTCARSQVGSFKC